jgi:hypothetical protein
MNLISQKIVWNPTITQQEIVMSLTENKINIDAAIVEIDKAIAEVYGGTFDLDYLTEDENDERAKKLVVTLESVRIYLEHMLDDMDDKNF